jgi:hypothetical protein
MLQAAMPPVFYGCKLYYVQFAGFSLRGLRRYARMTGKVGLRRYARMTGKVGLRRYARMTVYGDFMDFLFSGQ